MEKLNIARSSEGACGILPRLANRHGLVTGATGTGKTVTLQVLAEAFSRAGVPVFATDVKGDLSGLATSEPSHKLEERARSLGVSDYRLEGNPVVFWDLSGEQGHPIRLSLSRMGVLIVARLLDLNQTQEGVLHVAYKIADSEGIPLVDLDDLSALLREMAERRKEISLTHGSVSTQTIGAIQRKILVLESEGVADIFGEPHFDLSDFMRVDQSGRGIINLMDATGVVQNPSIYSAFLIWMLVELFNILPEVGDADRPKLVFIFDEAHLLFKDATKTLKNKIEQVVRLIRSKGVGVYLCSQNCTDIPDAVLGQLGHRIQHSLRAFTVKDRKAIRASADNFAQNPDIDIEDAITSVGVGEAVISMLDEKARPRRASIAKIYPPRSKIGPVSDGLRASVIVRSPFAVSAPSLNRKRREPLRESILGQNTNPEEGRRGDYSGFWEGFAKGAGSFTVVKALLKHLK